VLDIFIITAIWKLKVEEIGFHVPAQVASASGMHKAPGSVLAAETWAFVVGVLKRGAEMNILLTRAFRIHLREEHGVRAIWIWASHHKVVVHVSSGTFKDIVPSRHFHES
jgi:uncharacterized membrane protein YdcZ (DUF606 family)